LGRAQRMRLRKYWSLKMENEEGMEPLFLERKHIKFLTFWGALVASFVAALVLERFAI